MTSIQVRANTIFTAEQYDGANFPEILYDSFDCPCHIMTEMGEDNTITSTLFVDGRQINRGDWIVFVTGHEDFNVLTSAEFLASYVRV